MTTGTRASYHQSSQDKPAREPPHSPITPSIPAAAEGGSCNSSGTESRHDYDTHSHATVMQESGHEKRDDKPVFEKGSIHRGEARPRVSSMQSHSQFFDLNKDGRISPLETFLGFRSLGFNLFISFCAIFLINLPFAYISQDSWIPDPRLYIYIKNIHRAKHGSDSGIYDRYGNFNNEKFEDIFNKFGIQHKDHLTFLEGLRMTESFRQPFDPFGWFFSKLEFAFLFILCSRPLNRSLVVSKEDVRAAYDGSLFNKIKQDREAMRYRRQQ